MNTTAAQIPFMSTDSPQSSKTEDANQYRTILAAIYCVVLVSGTVSLSLMTHVLRSSCTSIISITVSNLIFAHFIFLVTVPFRIYYYASQSWDLGLGLCKVVSGMIHIHMYMSFIFYVIILGTRLMSFYHKAEQQASFRRIHVLLVSAVVWLAVLVVVPCIIHFSYGAGAERHNATANLTVCFNFGRDIKSAAKVFNYIISTLLIVAASVLTGLQANVLRVLYRKHRRQCTSQLDFGAQLKSLCFALIMAICFIPYHVFRIYYLEHLDLQDVNEVLLSLTTLNCLDVLTLLGKTNCYMCFLGQATRV